MNNNESNRSLNRKNTGPQTRTIDIVKQGLSKRYKAEKRFRLYGIFAIALSFLFLSVLFISIIKNGYTAFQQTIIQLDVLLDPVEIDEKRVEQANYSGMIKQSLRSMFPEVATHAEKRKLYKIVSNGAPYTLQKYVHEHIDEIDTTVRIWVAASTDIDMFIKGYITNTASESRSRISDKEISWLDTLKKQGRIKKRFNVTFFTVGDSRDPEQAGILGAVCGSFYILIVTLILSFPIGVATAIYLEEFAPINRWTDIIEVNINNLAAVPSIIFGLLGLSVFLNFFGLPRSAPLVGGLVLTLMTLPTIIIASRASLKSVPLSIREAALGIGASKTQMVLHHVLPLAMPGMLTGTIIGMAQALGETAPLLMIGMVAFIVDIPTSFMDPSTVLPVQIFLWADSPERGFLEKTSAAIMVLLLFLVAMNATAVFLRKKFEKKW